MSPKKTASQLNSATDTDRFRETVARYASGVTVVSSILNSDLIGFTCQAFYSVSLHPVLVSISVMQTSTSYPRIRESGQFVVNFLAEHQEELSNQFARSGTDKWRSIAWKPSPSGLPTLTGGLGWVECRIWHEYSAGDHLIVLGEVTAVSASDIAELKPLVFFNRSYRHLHPD